MSRRAGCLLLVSLTAPGCSQNHGDRLQTLAAAGKIQEGAPVKASSEIEIHASPEKIWHLLTDIDHWPAWQTTVSVAHLAGPIEPGTSFTWSSGGTRIVSRIGAAQPNVLFAWTGVAYGAKAVHVWNLQPLPDGGTLVKTSESMDGFMLTLFFNSKDLAKTHKVWLDAMKRAAEQ